jgi:signal transduction histidine kinase
VSRRAASTTAAIAYSAVAAGLAYLSLESDLTTPLWSLVALYAAGLTLTLTGWRRPRLAFAALLGLLVLTAAGGSGAESVLVILALAVVGVTAPAPRAWRALLAAVAAGALAAVVLALRLRSGPPLLGLSPRADVDAWPLDALSIGVVFAGMALIATLLGINVGHRRREVRALTERAEQLRRERDREVSLAASVERERIARELHDVIAHSLAVMIAVADGAHETAPTRPDEARRAMGRVAETGRRTLAEMRGLLTGVRGDERTGEEPGDDVRGDGEPAPALPQPGFSGIPSLVAEFREAGLPVRLEQTGALPDDAAIGLTVYRIVQEALTNVLRHARDVRSVDVRVAVGAHEVTVTVEDAAAVASAPTSPGRGLIGMRERGAFYDGHVETGPRPEGGWRVFARLPREQR